MEYLWWSLVFLTGACVGSFLNVCICRIPQGKSVVFPPSHCPYCLNFLKFFELLPIISYIVLRGKCRYCKSKISLQYTAVELFTGLLFVMAIVKYGVTLDALRAMVLFSVAIPATVIDLKYGIIPDKLNLAGFILGIPFIFESREAFSHGGVGFLAGGGLLLLIAVVSRGGMGGGDIKLAAVLGLLLGWKYMLVALFIAFLLGALAGLTMLALRVARLKEPIPFGPYLAFGAVMAALAGDWIAGWYSRFLAL